MHHHSANLRTFAAAFGSLLLLWLAFPPVGWFWLAWLALVPMIWLIAVPEFPGANRSLNDNAALRQSTGRPYWMIYLAGLAYWLGTFYFIPFPHPLLLLGWVAVSLYMACYWPLWIGLSRILVHRYRFPVGLAVPIVGTGLEWFRSNFLTGMPMICLSHSQYQQVRLIQIADLFGAYTVTFVILAFAASVAVISLRLPIVRWIYGRTNLNQVGRWNGLSHAVWGSAVLAASLAYGAYRFSMPIESKNETLRAALIQTSINVIFRELSAEERYQRDLHHWELTQAALQSWSDLDLVIWPESGFQGYDLLSDYIDEEGQTSLTAAETQAEMKDFFQQVVGNRAVPLLVGGVTYDPANQKAVYNSAILINPPGEVANRYFKNHLLMFGEYVPLAQSIPLLQQTPLGKGTNPGTEFTVMQVKGLRLAPCICFESTVPHLIRRMVNELSAQNQEVDVLINQTNDGWFFGSSCLDFHLACNVFRAVETRKPMLVCANTGFSAQIDHYGRLIQVGPRRQSAILKAEVTPTRGMFSLYRVVGDWVALIFGCGSILVGLVEAIIARRRD